MTAKTLEAPCTVHHKQLVAWVEKMAALCKPDQVYWCNGSQAEYDRLCDEMVASGTFIKLNQDKRPGCFLAGATPATWPAWKIARTSAVRSRGMPGRRTTGWPRLK